MANRNDFLILNKKTERYSKILADNVGIVLNVSDEEKRRLGFYIYILESVCNETVSEIIECVIDTQFNRLVFNKGVNDCGIDAIYINKDLKSVKLFNFKYRNTFKVNKTQDLNDSFISTKFLNLVLSDDKKEFNKFDEKIKNKLYELNEILINPQDEWKVELYQVSNEANEAVVSNNELKHLADLYAIEIKAIALDSISNFMSIRPKAINATIILDNDAVMCYTEDSKASAKSFIARMQCSEVLRITSTSETLREATSDVEPEKLANCYLDFSVLFDNVRGLVKNSKYNVNIEGTLKNDTKKFFMYNNGITLIAENINSKTLPGNKKLKLEIKNIQIVNGGQTVRTIHDFNQKNKENLNEYLYDAEVLVRMFIPDSDLDEAHKIAEYTNSQNPIKAVNLKSLSARQIEIERYLEEHDIAYARKTGDTGAKEEKVYKYTIDMETFGKILKARSGHPEKATGGAKDIFENQYEKLFGDDFEIQESPVLVEKYFKIIKEYKNLCIKSIQLKHFYIMYMDTFNYTNNIIELIHHLEGFLIKHSLYKDVGDVKTLSSVAFKSDLLEDLKIKYRM